MGTEKRTRPRGVPRRDRPDLHRPPAAQLDGLCVLEGRKGLAAALKEIYRATDADTAEKALTAFEAGPWGTRYPAIGQSWRRAWAEVIPFFAFPDEVRRIVYTTNAIEALNSKLRRAVAPAATSLATRPPPSCST